MESAREILQNIFSAFLYPVVIVGICLYVLIVQLVIVLGATDGSSTVRRITGAALPYAVLVFLVATTPEVINLIDSMFDETAVVLRFIVGAIGTAVLMELGKHMRTDALTGGGS